jgi:ubiquitin C-terminal hydrolase
LNSTPPQVQDHSSLLSSLVSLLSPEELVGDNQYDCAFCHGKRDATRRMVLRRLPPFLSLSLQRFVFDQRVCMGSAFDACGSVFQRCA